MSNKVRPKKSVPVELSDKVIRYIIKKDGQELVYCVVVDFKRLNMIIRELKRSCQYRVNGELKPTYLEYILRSFLVAVKDEEYDQFKIITRDNDSNNMINCIINYEHCGELGNSDENKFVLIPPEYQREFDLEVLRSLYEQVRESITFRGAKGTVFLPNDEINIDEMQKLRK